jgi:hypothetical protein
MTMMQDTERHNIILSKILPYVVVLLFHQRQQPTPNNSTISIEALYYQQHTTSKLLWNGTAPFTEHDFFAR